MGHHLDGLSRGNANLSIRGPSGPLLRPPFGPVRLLITYQLLEQLSFVRNLRNWYSIAQLATPKGLNSHKGTASLIHRFTSEPRYEKTGFLHICDNKDADQLRGDREADQRLCFRKTDSTILLLSKS